MTIDDLFDGEQNGIVPFWLKDTRAQSLLPSLTSLARVCLAPVSFLTKTRWIGLVRASIPDAVVVLSFWTSALDRVPLRLQTGLQRVVLQWGHT